VQQFVTPALSTALTVLRKGERADRYEVLIKKFGKAS